MRVPRISLAIAATGCISLAGAGALAQSAQGKGKTPERDQTYQMFADVGSNGDLGANHDADSVTLDTTSHIYTVTFTHKISKCAAAVNNGRSRGSDGVDPAAIELANTGSHGYIVRFTDRNGNVTFQPFMMTVTCNA